MLGYLQQQKAIIRAFIRANWSDLRLHEVYAFNRDGKMTYFNSCCCIMGVTDESLSLHTGSIGPACERVLNHYDEARELPHGIAAEGAYHQLGYNLNSQLGYLNDLPLDPDQVRQERLSAILRAEIRRRERAKRPGTSGGEDKRVEVLALA